MTETANAAGTWRDTDVYRWLMLHLRGNEKRVEELRDLLVHTDSPTFLRGGEAEALVLHLASIGNPGHGVVTAQYPRRGFAQYTVCATTEHHSLGTATRALTTMFATGAADWDWRVAFVLDAASPRDVVDLFIATRLHNRPVAVIAVNTHPYIDFNTRDVLLERLSPTLRGVLPSLATAPVFGDLEAPSFFISPTERGTQP